MKQTRKLTVFGLALAFGLSLLASQADASKGYGDAMKTSASLQNTQEKIKVALTELDKTMTPLNNLTSEKSDLRKDYETFSGELKDLKAVSEDIRAIVTQMGARSDEYFKKWQENAAAIASEDLRARAEERRTTTIAQLEKIRTLLGDARETFTPFVANLTDIDMYLSNELNRESVASISDLIQKANKDSESLKTEVTAVMNELSSFQAAISPKQ